MNPDKPDNIGEENLGRLIVAAAPRPSEAFDCKLTDAVREEIRRQQHARTTALRWRWGIGGGIAAAAAIVAVVTIIRWSPPKPPTIATPAGRLTSLYGLVMLNGSQTPRQAREGEELRAGQSLETRWGSGAELLLADESKLSVLPRTILRIGSKPDGERLTLQEGAVSIEAARQQPGRSLTVETPGSAVRILGTSLDVHVVHKPNGRRETRVSVHTGKVELTSAGQSVALMANMEGLAEEGQPPRSRSLTAEVNEMRRLLDRADQLAAAAGKPSGGAAIIEFNTDGSATVWTAVPLPNANATSQDYVLNGRWASSSVEAFTIEGASVPTTLANGSYRVDASALAPRQTLIVKLSGVPKLFETKGSGAFEVNLPAVESPAIALVQFRLPATARVEQLSPAPLETTETLWRKVLTVVAQTRLPDFVN